MSSNSSESTAGPESPSSIPVSHICDRSDLYDLYLARSRGMNWVLENLVMMGDQVILAGAPKTYKSLWASHLALALSMGAPDFLGWKIPKPRKVLFLSMEMREELVANRILHQLAHLAPIDFESTPELDIRAKPIIHVFDVEERHSIDVKKDSDFHTLHRIITEEDPDVVIFDSLIRFHASDENSNPDMSDIMQRMRELCLIAPKEEASKEPERSPWDLDANPEDEGSGEADDFYEEEYKDPNDWESHYVPYEPDDSDEMEESDNSDYRCELDKPEESEEPEEPNGRNTKSPKRYRTSIIIHHSRKEPGSGTRSYSVASMRGASSIHSEADLVIATFPLLKDKEVSMNFSARKVLEPEFMVIGLDTKSLLLEVREKKTQSKSASLKLQHLPFALRVLAENRGTYMGWSQIQELALKIKGCSKRGASHPSDYGKYFRKALESYCDSKGEKNRKTYRLQEEIDIEDEGFLAELEAALDDS
jgi:hypothetical protein